MIKKILKKIISGINALYMEERTAIANEMEFEVLRNGFWPVFNAGLWEPETLAFYRKHVSPLKEVIDIGAWIGPTVLMAYSLNPKKVSAVEADPANYQVLKRNCLRNYLADKVELHCVCISDKTGETVNFGYIDKKDPDDSMKAIGKAGVKVKTVALKSFLQTKNLPDTNIIKIDIEGGEQYIEEGLGYIAAFQGINILLSMHPPFWADLNKTTDMFLRVFQKFTVYSGKEEILPDGRWREMISEKGNGSKPAKEMFFTLILKTKILVDETGYNA